MGPGKRLAAMYLVLAGLSGGFIPNGIQSPAVPNKAKGGSFKANRRKAMKGKGVRR